MIAALGVVGVLCTASGLYSSLTEMNGFERVLWSAVMLVLTIAIAWLAFWRVPRSCVEADEDGVTIRGALSSRALAWDQIERFEFLRVAHFGKGVVVTRDGSTVDMSSITTPKPIAELNALLETRRGGSVSSPP